MNWLVTLEGIEGFRDNTASPSGGMTSPQHSLPLLLTGPTNTPCPCSSQDPPTLPALAPRPTNTPCPCSSQDPPTLPALAPHRTHQHSLPLLLTEPANTPCPCSTWLFTGPTPLGYSQDNGPPSNTPCSDSSRTT